MDREIKFRGQRVDNGEWVTGYYGELTGGETTKSYIMTNTLSFNPNKSLYFTDIEVIPSTIGQFTGLLDKNGKEIYEGDLLKAKKRIFQVKYYQYTGGYQVVTTDTNPNEIFCTQLNQDNADIYEIIGTIHDKEG